MTNTPTRMRRTLVSTGLSAGLLAGGAVALAPAPSYADTARIADRSGDVVRIDDQDDDGTDETTRVPDERALDITSTVVHYRSRVLVVRATTREPSDLVSPRVRVRAGGRDVELSTDDRGRVYADDRGGGTRCRGAAATSDARFDGTGVHRIEIPARCFGAPAAVRVGYRLDRVGDTTASSITLDDAVKGGGGRRYHAIGLGPRVVRG